MILLPKTLETHGARHGAIPDAAKAHGKRTWLSGSELLNVGKEMGFKHGIEALKICRSNLRGSW